MLKSFQIPICNFIRLYSTPPIGNAAYKLQFHIGEEERKIYYAEGVGSGYTGKMMMMRRCVTSLIDEERIELKYVAALEARKYAERLIQEGIIKGRKCPFTTELMQFWLQETRLVDKMFEVIVPRYRTYNISYTRIFKLPIPRQNYVKFPEHNAVLELRHNPYPPIITKYQAIKKQNKSQFLTNVLVSSLREEWEENIKSGSS